MNLLQNSSGSQRADCSWKIVWGFWQWKISPWAFNLTCHYIRLACLRQIIKPQISFQLAEKQRLCSTARGTMFWCTVSGHCFSISCIAAVCTPASSSICWRKSGFTVCKECNFFFFFPICDMSKYKLLVQVSGKDSNQIKGTISILFCLTTV